MRRNLSRRGARGDEGHYGRRRQGPRPSSRSQGSGARRSKRRPRSADARASLEQWERISPTGASVTRPKPSAPSSMHSPQASSRQPPSRPRCRHPRPRKHREDGKTAMASGRRAMAAPATSGRSSAVAPEIRFRAIKFEAWRSREREPFSPTTNCARSGKRPQGPGHTTPLLHLILTGQRRGEVAGHDPGRARRLTCRHGPSPAAGPKTASPISCLCRPRRRTILSARPQSDGSWQTRIPGAGGPFTGWSKAKEQPRPGLRRRRLDAPRFRRTAATGLQKLGVRLEVTEAILNHVSGSRAGIIGVYQRHTGPMRNAPRSTPGARMSPRSSRDVRRTTSVPLQARSR